MAEKSESLLIRMAFESTQVEEGTRRMLEMQKKASMEYVSWWQSAAAKRDAAEAAANDRSLARLARWQAAQKAATAQYMEERAAQIEMEKGSGGFGWIGDAAGAAGGVAKAGHEVGNMRVVSREFLVIMREIGRGNWGRVFGSVSIMLQSMGGVMSRLMQSVFGPFGIALAVIGTAAYALYKDIKAFTTGLDEVAKQNAESIGDTAKAVKDATDTGIKSAAEYEAHIKSLAGAHETLAEWAEKSAQAIEKAAAAQEKLITAEGNRQIAAINLAEHMGIVTPAQAAGARTQSKIDTFNRLQTAKFNALEQEGQTLGGAYGAAVRNQSALEIQGRQAQAAVTGVDENGNIVNRAAFNRAKQMRERANLQQDIEKREAQVMAYNGTLSIDPLHKQKDALNEAQQDIIAKEKALLAKTDAQNRKNIAAQAEAEAAYKKIAKEIDENADSIKKLSVDLQAYGDKFKDQVTAMRELRTNLIGQSLDNASAQQSELRSMDRANPTIEDLAGTGYMNRLHKELGEKLRDGKGPFAATAQDYEQAMAQQALDVKNGWSHFNEKGELDGGRAYQDQQRAMTDRNLLGAAGIATPAMQMADLIANGKAIQGEIQALNLLMSQHGIKLNDESAPPAANPPGQ